MIDAALSYSLKHPLRAVRAVASDPIGALQRGMDVARQRRDAHTASAYVADPDWERHLHDILGAAWPCEEATAFWQLWPDLRDRLTAAGINIGPESFGCWNDGDLGLLRAAWCLVRHLAPRRVVETGVAHGVTSRVILEALDRNGEGHLWSIDLPPFNRDLAAQVGAAVDDRCRARWTYIEGASRRRLPPLIAALGNIELFLHDSDHSDRNVFFEMSRAWAALRPPGAILVDDIDVNNGFASFAEAFPGPPRLVCEAEPLREDSRRFNRKGLFGVVVKPG